MSAMLLVHNVLKNALLFLCGCKNFEFSCVFLIFKEILIIRAIFRVKTKEFWRKRWFCKYLNSRKNPQCWKNNFDRSGILFWQFFDRFLTIRQKHLKVITIFCGFVIVLNRYWLRSRRRATESSSASKPAPKTALHGFRHGFQNDLLFRQIPAFMSNCWRNLDELWGSRSSKNFPTTKSRKRFWILGPTAAACRDGNPTPLKRRLCSASRPANRSAIQPATISQNCWVLMTKTCSSFSAILD